MVGVWPIEQCEGLAHEVWLLEQKWSCQRRFEACLYRGTLAAEVIFKTISSQGIKTLRLPRRPFQTPNSEDVARQ